MTSGCSTGPGSAARELDETLQQLTEWAERNRTHVAESRAAYDTEHRPEPLDA